MYLDQKIVVFAFSGLRADIAECMNRNFFVVKLLLFCTYRGDVEASHDPKNVNVREIALNICYVM